MTSVVYVLMVTLLLPGSLGTTAPAMLPEDPFQTLAECEAEAAVMQHREPKQYTLNCEAMAILPPEKRP